MRIETLREMTVEELKDQIREIEENLFLLKMQHGVGQLDDTSKLRRTKRDLAQAKTVLREHDLGIRMLAGHD